MTSLQVFRDFLWCNIAGLELCLNLKRFHKAPFSNFTFYQGTQLFVVWLDLGFENYKQA